LNAVSRILEIQLRPAEINGSPGTLLLDGRGRLIAVWALEIGSGGIQAIRSIVNPEKLAHLGPTAEPDFLLRAPRR
jgi:RNA polymerase sigma-70 factor (ECF subfamily)